MIPIKQLKDLCEGHSPQKVKQSIQPEMARQMLAFIETNRRKMPRFIRRRAQKELTKIASRDENGRY